MAEVWCCFCLSFSSRRRHTRCLSDWSSDVCSSDLDLLALVSCVEELVAGLEKPREEVARSLRGLKNQQRILDSHVAAIENSLIFRFLRRLGGPLPAARRWRDPG